MVTTARRTTSAFSLSGWLSGLLAGFRRPSKSAAPVADCRPRDAVEMISRGKRNKDRMAMQTLESGLKAGRITPQEYAARLAQISETPSP